MFCKICGHEVEQDDKFCLNCGSPILAIQPIPEALPREEITEAPASVTEPPAAQEIAPEEPAQPLGDAFAESELAKSTIQDQPEIPAQPLTQAKPVISDKSAVPVTETAASGHSATPQAVKPARACLHVSQAARVGLTALHLIPAIMCVAAIVLWFCALFSSERMAQVGISAAELAQTLGVGILTTVVVALYAVTGLFCLIPIIAKSVSKPRTPVMQIIVAVFGLELSVIAYALATMPDLNALHSTYSVTALFWGFAGANVCLLLVPCITSAIVHHILMRAVRMNEENK